MGEMHVAKGRVTIGGLPVFEITDEQTEHPGLPISLDWAHRDNMASMAHLVVFDRDDLSETPLPIFNAAPDPLVEHEVPYTVEAGWEDDDMLIVFEGILLAVETSILNSVTTLVGIHDSYPMRKKAKVRHKTNMSVADLMRLLGSEH